MVSYEAALGLAVASVVLMTGSLSTHDIVVLQAGEGFGGILPRWNAIVTGLVPFIVFAIAGTAELNRPPFDLVEAEQELVGGFHTEYSSIRFALFFLAEFMNTITMSAIIVTLFFGGPAGPVFLNSIGGFDIAWMWGFVWFLREIVRVSLLFRVGAGHSASFPLRPAHGSGMENADTSGIAVVSFPQCAQDR